MARFLARRVFGLLSFWTGGFLALLIALQSVDAIGPALVDANAPAVAGWFVHLFLLSLCIDALFGRISPVIIALPAIFYGGYASLAFQQGRRIAQKSELLTQANPGRVVDFDLKSSALVLDDADVFIATHKLALAYVADKSYRPAEYVSYRLASDQQIVGWMRDLSIPGRIFAVVIDGAPQSGHHEFSVPEAPDRKIVSVEAEKDGEPRWADWMIGERTTLIKSEGRIVGRFRSGYVDRLTWFPLMSIGFRPSPGAGRRAFQVDFATRREDIESRPLSVDRAKFDDPASVMLAIPLRGVGDIGDPTPPAPLSVANLAERSGASAEQDLAFKALDDILNDRAVQPPWNTRHFVAGDPKRIAPMAPKMVEKLAAWLQRPGALESPGAREQAAIIEAGLVSLPKDAFVNVAEPLIAFARSDEIWSEFPGLTLRLADFGVPTFSLFRDRLLAADTDSFRRLLSALAICRIGQADGELLSAMRAQFAKPSDPAENDGNLKSALFVALSKLDPMTPLRYSAAIDASPDKLWFEAVAQGHGETDLGPNNCMAMAWPKAEELPREMSARLGWNGEGWTVGATQ